MIENRMPVDLYQEDIHPRNLSGSFVDAGISRRQALATMSTLAGIKK